MSDPREPEWLMVVNCHVGTENKTPALSRATVLLIIEPSLQPQTPAFFMWLLRIEFRSLGLQGKHFAN